MQDHESPQFRAPPPVKARALERIPPTGTDTDAALPPLARTSRAVAAGICFCCLCVLGIAAWLRPDPRGHGTHEQLGLAPCGLLIASRYPCPTCGMTTAFAHTVRGQWLQAAWVQPGGFVLALGTIATAIAAGWSAVTGRNPFWPLLPWLTPFRVYAGLLLIFLGGWAFRCALIYSSGSATP